MPLYNPIQNSDLIHITDTANNFISDNVESALAELGGNFKSTAADESAALGEELLDGTGWTLGTGWSGDFATGFVHTPGNTAPLTRTMVDTGTQFYQIEFTVTSPTASAVFVVSIGNSVDFETYQGAGTEYVYKFGIKSVSNGDFVIKPIAGDYIDGRFDGTISNISIKQITGAMNPTTIIKDGSNESALEIRPTPAAQSNLFIGVDSGRYNTSGQFNTALGNNSLKANMSGYWNTAIGESALLNNTVGSRNIAIGRWALMNNISGHRNIVLGTFCMKANTHGHNNIALGADALWDNTTGAYNISAGVASMAHNITGESNIALGRGALGANTALSNQVAIGDYALASLTGAGASESVAIGHDAARNTTGTNNVVLGGSALVGNTTGTNNVAIGRSAMRYGLTSASNVVIGHDAGKRVEGATGGFDKSVLIGTGAGLVLGNNADNNILIGYNAGSTMTTGKNNIIIGYAAEPSAVTKTYELNLGGTLYGNLTSKQIRIGAANPTAAMHLPASTTAVNTAPIKIETGVLMTTPEAGAIEYDGTNLYFTNAAGERKTLAVVA